MSECGCGSTSQTNYRVVWLRDIHEAVNNNDIDTEAKPRCLLHNCRERERARRALASYPGSRQGEGKGEPGIYQLCAHALNFPSFWENSHSLRSLPCDSDVIIIVTV